jgi:mitogen-activated protein kinase organizer 1
VFVWDVTRGETTRRFQGHSGKVNAVAFNEESTILASGTWRLSTLRVIAEYVPSASFDTHVRLWDMK